MEAPDVAAFVVTLEGVIAGWGDGVASLLGYRADEVIGRDVSIFLPGEHPSHFPRILAAAARGQRIETFETMVGRDGLRLQVALRAVPTRNGGGQVTGARATLRDVTPERSEEAHSWMTALLESSHDGIYALDGRGVIRNWSPGAERLYGYAAHEAVGLPYTSLFPDNRHEEAAMALDCALAGEPVSLFDTEARRKDGGLVPSFLNLWPIWDRRGKVAGISAIARDVTEEQLIQEALADSQARLRDTEVMARIGHWAWDVGTGAVQWSEGLHRIFGTDPVHFGGTLEAHLETIHPGDRERVLAEMRESVSNARPFAVRYRMLRPDGTTSLLESRADVAPGPTAGTVAGLRGICQVIDPSDDPATRSNEEAAQ
jgi:two-component system CheB/CheR fusion protein